MGTNMLCLERCFIQVAQTSKGTLNMNITILRIQADQVIVKINQHTIKSKQLSFADI